MSNGSSVEAIAQRLITQKQLSGAGGANTTYDNGSAVMVGPLHNTSMTASGMSL